LKYFCVYCYHHYHFTTVPFVRLLQCLTKSNTIDDNKNSNNITIDGRLFQIKPLEGFFWAKEEIQYIFPTGPDAGISLVHLKRKELPGLLFANLPAAIWPRG
jgi:hypothetical protein